MLNEMQKGDQPIRFQLGGAKARIFVLWYQSWAKLTALLQENSSISKMWGSYIGTVLMGWAIKALFPKLEILIAFIGHFRASCTWEKIGDVLEFTMIPSSLKKS